MNLGWPPGLEKKEMTRFTPYTADELTQIKASAEVALSTDPNDPAAIETARLFSTIKALQTRLVEIEEDLEDLASMKEVDRGKEDFLPAKFVDRMLAGENLVRLWREHRGLEQQELAASARITAGELSEIESGGSQDTLDVYKRLAEALNVEIDDLV